MITFTGILMYSVVTGVSITTLVYIMIFFIIDGNIFTTLDNTAKLMVTAINDVNEIVKSGHTVVTTANNGSTMVTTSKNTNTSTITIKDTNTSLTAIKDTKMPFATIDNHNNTVSTFKNVRFAIVYSYWEQQTNAILNMWSLQKWANFMGFKVLEPFAHQSTLALTDEILYHYNFTNILRFRDYFDLNFWTNETKEKYGIPPVEKWGTFAVSPLKKTVVVILAYDVFPVGEYVGNGINKHPDCVKQKNKFYNRHAKLFDRLHIQVVRNVCFVFNHKAKSPIPLHLFNSLILPDHMHDANVWFSYWRGIQFDRIAISDHYELRRDYDGEGNILGMVRTSPRVLQDSRNYVNTILKVDFKEYTAVTFRTGNRRTELVRSGYSREQVIQYFHRCAEQIKQTLVNMSSSAKFLSIDLGRFGDLTAVYEYFKINDDGTKLFKFILDNVYGNKSIDQYENELIRAANGIEDSGYIGSMEKTISENAKHLIVVGGRSSFQRSMVTAFTENNQNCQKCITCICYD